jgi:hypothetical protein
MVPKSNNSYKYWFIVTTVLISINLWSFQVIPETIYKAIDIILLVALVLVVLNKHSVFKEKHLFKNGVLLFLFIPILSCFSALFFHDQPLDLSFLILRTNFFWLFYFVLHIYNVSTERIIKLILFTGVVWAALTIAQQFTYPKYYFFNRSDTETYSILRSGVYRFMISGQQYGMFVLLYFFYRYLLNRKVNYLIFIAIGLIGFYYYGTRQYALAGAACMCISFFVVKGNAKINAILFLLPGLFLIIYLKDFLFGQYIEMTNEQLSYGDDIRQLSGDFWLNEYWPHWGAKLFGNGKPHILSEYGQEMEKIRDFYHFYRSDVGIIGAYNEFGIFYVLTIIWINIKGMRQKYFRNQDGFLNLLFFYSTILLLTSQSYSSPGGIIFYCFLFYLTEKSFEEKKKFY